MQITLKNTGKRFNREWIFRRVNFNFEIGRSYAITGANGSGKSTLLQVIAGAVLHNEGTIAYSSTNSNIELTGTAIHKTASIQQQILSAEAYKHIVLCAPYLELIEEMTAVEFMKFHSHFKSFIVTIDEILLQVGLKNAADKQIRYYSSGMKQRLKLAQAFFSNSTAILLDEPTTNLDADGIALYQQLIRNYTAGKLLIVSSNDKDEYNFCDHQLSMADYK